MLISCFPFAGVSFCGSDIVSFNVLMMVVYAWVVASWVAASNCSNSLHAFTESGSLFMASHSFCNARCCTYYNRHMCYNAALIQVHLVLIPEQQLINV